MILKMYAVLDTGIGVYTPPFCVRHEQEAIRSFMGTLADPSHAMTKDAQDFSLHRVGAYDDSSGLMQSLPASELVITAVSALAQLKGE